MHSVFEIISFGRQYKFEVNSIKFTTNKIILVSRILNRNFIFFHEHIVPFSRWQSTNEMASRESGSWRRNTETQSFRCEFSSEKVDFFFFFLVEILVRGVSLSFFFLLVAGLPRRRALIRRDASRQRASNNIVAGYVDDASGRLMRIESAILAKLFTFKWRI